MSALGSIDARPGLHVGRDVLLAAALAAAGLVEVLAVDGEGAGSAVLVVCATVPLAWRRTLPLLPVAMVALALVADEALGGVLVGRTATPVVAIAIALYSAGRHASRALVAAVAGVAVLSGVRVAADPAVDDAGQVVLTVVALSLPLLVGRWVRGQALLQGALARTATRLARDRERDARRAAEAERMRIAGDLQAAIAGGLREIAADADALPGHLRAGETTTARTLLARSATTAREVLADVRRVLGILRREGQPLRLDPPAEPAPAETVAAERPVADVVAVEAPPRVSPVIVDRLLAGAVLVGIGLELGFAALLAGVLIAAPLLWRRRYPRLVFVAVIGGIALQSALLDRATFPVSDIAAVVCATYATAAYAERRAAHAGLVLALAGVGVHAAVFYPEGVAAALLGGVLAPWTLGRVVRAHRGLTREGREEAAQAERERAREAAAAVTRERMRIARELHDAVAHNISVIALQAGGADGIVERDPERAAESAALIGTVAREALVELERLSRALDAEPDGDRHGLESVGDLTERARATGLQVDLGVEGEPAALPAGLDLAAYRIVQEALANASKHAHAGRARVTVRYARRAVELEVADDGRGPAPAVAATPTDGHGLAGMRERAALYGGTLDAGPGPQGGFRVRARLPIA